MVVEYRGYEFDLRRIPRDKSTALRISAGGKPFTSETARRVNLGRRRTPPRERAGQGVKGLSRWATALSRRLVRSTVSDWADR